MLILYRTCVVILLFDLVLLGESGALESAELSITNDRLQVTLSVPTGILAVKDRQSGIQWSQSVPIRVAQGRDWGKVSTRNIAPRELIEIKRTSIHGKSIRAEAAWQGQAFLVTYELTEDGDSLAVTIDMRERAELLPWEPGWAGTMLMTYPYPFFDETAGAEMVVPIDEGVIYSTREINTEADPRRWRPWWLFQKLSMPWWGVTDGERGVMTHVETPYDAMFSVQWCSTPEGERSLPHITWVGSKRSLAYPRRVTFTDCTTTGGSIQECSHPEHLLSRRAGSGQLNRALQGLADLGFVVGSERGKWWATSSTHVFEGIETLIEYSGSYYGSGDESHWVGPYLKNKPGYRELCLGFDFNPARRVPLFQLVYHDSVYCARRWNQDPLRDKALWNRHDLMNILYGTPPLWFMHPKAGNVIGSPEWEHVKGRYLQTYNTVCGWHERIGFDEMTDHHFLSDDRLVQETRFRNGLGVVVNFSAAPWPDRRGFIVPAVDFRILE